MRVQPVEVERVQRRTASAGVASQALGSENQPAAALEALVAREVPGAMCPPLGRVQRPDRARVLQVSPQERRALGQASRGVHSAEEWRQVARRAPDQAKARH